ncbi:MAG: SPOR domain-containing protein [Crocinitomicaceae bacterium]
MSSVEGIIGQLLLRHNCVIIPSFGGFVAKQVSAKIDFENGTMYPPSKSLLFNRQLVNNDGLLINEYASANGKSFDQASAEVKEVTDHWKSKLHSGGRIEIDKVGKLFFDAENNICFEQDRFYNLLLESFGLSKVHFLSEEDVKIVESTIELIEKREQEVTLHIEKEPTALLETEKEEEAVKIVPITLVEPVEEKVIPHPVIVEQKKKGNMGWRIVAVACLFPIAFYSFWIPLKTDVLQSGVISVKDFNPFYNAPESVYTPQESEEVSVFAPEAVDLEAKIEELPESATVYSVKYADDHYVAVELPEKTVTEVNVEEIPASEKVEEVVSANAMHYVVGAFGNKSNAKKLVKELRSKGLDARIVGYTNGLHRVASGSAISEEALEDLINKSKELGHPGWVLR